MAADTQNNSSLQAALLRWMPLLLIVVFIAGVLHNLSRTIWPHSNWIQYIEDDFFYYLKIAQNLAAGKGSTSNGLVATNGYHPLWLLLISALSFFSTSELAVRCFLVLSIFTAYLTTFLFSRSLILRSGANTVVSTALAVYISLNCLRLFIGGMEIVLTIPLVLAVALLAQKVEFWQRGFWQAACLGLLVSAMALSRLDTILLAAMFFVGCLLHRDVRRALTRPVILGLSLGLLPVILYVASNKIFFHTLMPVSGMAKQLRFHHTPALATFKSLFVNLTSQRTQMLGALLCVIAICLLPVVFHRMTAMQQILYPAILLFPVVYYSILSCLSDWQLWEWYFYPLRVALCIAFAIFFLLAPVRSLLNQPVVGLTITAAMIGLAAITHNVVNQEALLLEVANDVRNFSSTHPGVYAMGDRAGIVAYLLPYPLVQTEGLTMDREFLNNIQHETPLRDALAKYNVRYFIVTTHPPFTTGCQQITEPYQAGPDSRHMRAEFCEQPLAVFEQENLRTSIYDLKPEAIASTKPNVSQP